MKGKFFVLAFFSLLFVVIIAEVVSAHCPLCTIGAGAAAAGAVWLGVQKVAVAVLIGGFAMSMGMWFARVIRKRWNYFKGQDAFVIIGVFLLTVLPILPIIGQTTGFYLSLFGDYGGLFNRTYVLNLSLFSSLLGGVIVYFSPLLSKKVTKLRRNKIIPFQGIILTIALLIVTGAIVHFVV
jgi:hypothetical protein